MDALQTNTVCPELSIQYIPAVVLSLIEGAVAAFDADRTASIRDLLRAAAILRAGASHTQGTHHKVQHQGGLVRWQLNRIIDYIDQHIAERITGAELAKVIDVSIGQLFRAFKATVGIPPLQYVAARRLELACSLLRTTKEPLSQVALACGFCDQSHLCRVFRRLLGASPTVWRRTQHTRSTPCGASVAGALMPSGSPAHSRSGHHEYVRDSSCANFSTPLNF